MKETRSKIGIPAIKNIQVPLGCVTVGLMPRVFVKKIVLSFFTFPFQVYVRILQNAKIKQCSIGLTGHTPQSEQQRVNKTDSSLFYLSTYYPLIPVAPQSISGHSDTEQASAFSHPLRVLASPTKRVT